ncbi:MAG: lytic murein transglycosylase B [Candidatus Thiodiazotropha lotti]|nr:lytic murein transglycosylase B [Candidatus Thiodiazotropha weberae]MCG7991917.1 lytic murein transglycosylase B [Candidatus Thiodiazotropha lotti]MCG7914876.1 lytic murein transglycosylase B [Candidatus Thiodiazotropha weberae]MCG7998421.1 lytic murein transglycosylase B [Candidatus Thiodiazotropha lotti]MCW4183575.1 lytic murein transglycosylase B [Candidatus Thiodiazotropha weberae]
MKRITTQITLFLLISLSNLACAHTPQMKAEFRAFADEMANKHGFEAAEVDQLLLKTRFRDDIIAAITRPAESKAWYQYRPIFLKPDRVAGGIDFWHENAALLEQAYQTYGVPPEIIVAIIGVETRYGRHTGKYKVIDSLTTLAFGYPKRAKFFRKELEQFLLLSREEQVDPYSALGSYAGAMGKPQFISSSYRRYAVDGNADDKRDLWNSNADIIASVANYFKVHGWQKDQPITRQVQGSGDLQKFVEAGMKPSIKVAELIAAGVKPLDQLPLDAEAQTSLIKLDAGNHQQYWLGLDNFYVITRYNHSNLYAMAVYQLSQEILASKQASRR